LMFVFEIIDHHLEFTKKQTYRISYFLSFDWRLSCFRGVGEKKSSLRLRTVFKITHNTWCKLLISFVH
jgi:hypothetical protein